MVSVMEGNLMRFLTPKMVSMESGVETSRVENGDLR